MDVATGRISDQIKMQTPLEDTSITDHNLGLNKLFRAIQETDLKKRRKVV